MKSLTTPDPLELEVANFGPIVEAKIDLRPLTVFVGPSNTGKSYLAILIYALHRFFSGRRWQRSGLFEVDRMRRLSRETIAVLVKWAEQISADREKISIERSIVLPASVVDVIRSRFDAHGDNLGQEIVRSFGTNEVGALVRKEKRDRANVLIRRRPPNDSAPLEHRLTIGAHGTEFKAAIPEGMPIKIDDKSKSRFPLRHLMEDYEERATSSWYWTEVLAALIEHALPRVFTPLHLPAFYLPADRTGVMHAHSVVVSAMIGSAPMTGLRPAADTPMLSGVLADFLQQLIELDRPPYRRHKSRRDLGTQIEEAILGGSVRVDRSETIDYPYFTYQPKGWKKSLPLMNASSMVSELAPVVLYLRYMVRRDNVLIIEEPESHLHPAMQVEFTRQIAALVRTGVRVVVTTHSEWVLETLANLVRLSELPKARRRGIEGTDLVLRPDQVGAWLFKQKRRPKGSVVEEVKLDDEIGLYPTDYDAVSEALYNESVSIFNRIQDRNAI